jgi:uncharacterized protein DUF5667
MPAGQGKDAERFAAAVESRTPLVAADDAELARDLEIVALLRARGAAFSPDAESKERAKQRLLAVLAGEQAGPDARPDRAPRPASQGEAGRHAAAPPPAETELTAPLGRFTDPVSRADEDVDPTAETALMAPVTAQLHAAPDAGAESDVDAEPDAETSAAPAAGRAGRAGRRARHRVANRPSGAARSARRPAAIGLRRRALLVGSVAMVAMVAIAGGGIFASQGALPGDNLYAIKQASESAGLALTFDDAGKARRHLDIAATRLSEVEQLAARGAAPAPEVFSEAMDEFNAATDEGARLLLESTDEPTGDEAAASDLRDWAAEQSERLSELEPELPPAADAGHSMQLLDHLLDRAEGTGGEPECDGDDCDPRRTSDANAPETDEGDTSEDATSTPDKSDSSDARETDKDEPTRTPTRTSDGDDPRLLPDLAPDSDREREDGTTTSTTNEDEDSTSESKPDAASHDEEDGDISVPLPLLPPVTLPPLLPGMPGITLG